MMHLMYGEIEKAEVRVAHIILKVDQTLRPILIAQKLIQLINHVVGFLI